MKAQIIFLIDTNVDSRPDSLATSICLSCLRLLSNISARFEKGLLGKKSKQSHLKWSYKFFNSKVHTARIEQHKTYDFKLRHFEEFENELLRRIDTKNSASTVSKSLRPAENINKAFTEVLADFKWESHELMSPVKGRKHKRDQTDQLNIVFLFTKSPKSFQEFKDFTGKRVLDEEIFLNSLFPNTLLHQFTKISKIILHWIDTQHYTSAGNGSDPLAVEIVRRAVETVGGSVVSLHCFASQICPYLTNANCLVEDVSADKKSSLSSQSQELLPLSAVIQNLISSKQRVFERRNILSKENIVTVLHIGDKKLEVSLSEQTADSSCIKTSSPQDIHFPYQSNLQGYAIVQKNLLSHNLSIQCSYLCVERIRREKGKSSGANNNGALKALLSKLAVQKSIMVLMCVQSGQLVILEPLTTHTGTLSLLSPQTSLTLEKMLVCQKNKGSVNTDMSEANELTDEIASQAVNSLHLKKENDVCKEMTDASRFDGQQMGSWIVPGCTKSVHKLVNKLNERISELDFLSTDEMEALKQLKKMYKAERQPPGLRDTSFCNTSITGLDAMMGVLDKVEAQSRVKSSRASLSRADKILFKSKEMVEVDKQKKETAASTSSKADNNNRTQVAASLSDFENLDELKKYLTSTYEKTVSGQLTDIENCVQSLVTVASHYFQQKENKTTAQESCKKTLEETLLSSGSHLREKYSQSHDLSQEQKIAEYQMQILLRMEIISSVEGKEKAEDDEVVEEIVGMLRTLSFIAEPGFLSKFMQTSFLHSYMHTIPQTLASIYDELMQPLPDLLANILSPDGSGGNQSGLHDNSIGSDDAFGGPPSARTRSHGSVNPPSSQPNKPDLNTSLSRGSRKLVHHYSIDFGPKRQIVVDKITKKQSERSAKKKSKTPASKRKIENELKSPRTRKKSGAKLQRHQSVAVMQRTHKTPKKNDASKHRSGAVTPRRQVGKLVAETPCHKQVPSVLNRTLPDQLTTEDVVMESPEKACDISLGNTPTKGKRAKALLRRSFYSAGPTKRTKNLSQYFQLANRIAGRPSQALPEPKKQSKLISFEAPDEFKSPSKNSSFILSQLGASPSPAKATPKKITKTPSKVLDSPCRNTRSKVGESPSVRGHGHLSVLASPLSHSKNRSPLLQSKNRASQRKQSPRVLVFESDVKKGPSEPQTTPEKSPPLGVVSFGLDSPSQNTRKRLAQTPTRKSVRAALFAKSPVARKHSPYRGTASPRTLMDKFGSPVKANKMENNVSNLCMNSSLPLPQQPLATSQNVEPKCSASGKWNVIPSSETLTNEKPNVGTKTPSPRKKVLKTPDSFDKWRRVKQPASQKSPSSKKANTVTQSNPLNECQIEEMNKMNRKVDSEVDKNQTEDFSMKRVKGSYRKKRCLLQSPEKSIGSLSKRQRTITDGQWDSLGSQGFDVTGSQNELSQISNASSVDYFSAVNDDVFLSQSEDVEMTDASNDNVRPELRIRKRLLSDDHGFGRSQSPIFGSSSSKNLNVSKKIVEDDQNISVNRNDACQISPARVIKSPATKKYSPNVSAKSLMHLIQSPLLHSPEGRAGRRNSKMLSPNSAMVSPKSKPTGAQSRRSLKLHN